jgi:hypothetical protein
MPSFAESLEAGDGEHPNLVIDRYDRQIRLFEKIIEQGIRLRRRNIEPRRKHHAGFQPYDRRGESSLRDSEPLREFGGVRLAAKDGDDR